MRKRLKRQENSEGIGGGGQIYNLVQLKSI